MYHQQDEFTGGMVKCIFQPLNNCTSLQEMEIASQDGNGPVSQSASSRGNSPGSGEASLSQEGEWSHQSLVTADVEGLSLNQIVQV